MGLQKLNLDRKAEKTMTEVRLKIIEREHRSVGALLDHRAPIPLVAPKLRNIKLERMEGEQTRRAAAETSAEVRGGSLDAQRAMTNKGIAIVSVDNYENEELIWATKSRDPAYSQKRKYYFKDLQEFKDNMTAEQRVAFKRLTHDRLVDIANKYRAEMAYMKEEMDLAGVFHPEANAHRAHCMYLMKLHKGIRSETIEDPILRRLRDEELAEKKLAEDEERKQRELLESIENKSKVAPSQSMSQAVPDARLAVVPVGGSADAPQTTTDEGKKQQQQMRGSKSTKTLKTQTALPPPLKRSETSSLPLASNIAASSLPNGSKKKSTAVVTKSEKATPENAALAAAAAGVTAAGVTTTTGEDFPLAEDAEVHASNDSKLFTKIKRGKLGGSDPKALLIEEAARLERSEVVEVKKVRERSSLVDSEMTGWMLGLLQSNQIEKTAQGRDVVPTTVDLFATSLAASEGGVFDEASAYSPNKESQRTVPFGEFYDMFRAYSAEAKERKEREREKERKRLEKESKRLLNKHHHSSDGGDELHRSDGHPPEGDAHAHHHELNPSQQHQPYNHHTNHQEGSESTLESFVEPPERIDLIQIMKGSDPQFAEYYKMMLRQKPQGAKLFKGTATKIPKIRAMAPLGKSAVIITDSKGSEKAISSKGFFNLFAARTVLSEESTRDTVTLHTDEKTRDDESIPDTPIQLADTAPPTPSFPGAVPSRLSSPAMGERRTPSPSNSRRSRNRSRGKKPGLIAQGAAGEDVSGPDFQAKLVCVWDSLQTPALQRLAFMRKYATKAFAAELTRATDMWAEATVLVLARLNLVERSKVKVREGYAVLPLLANDLLAGFLETIPSIFTSVAPSLCFQASEISPLATPLSVLMIQRIKEVVRDLIPSSAEDSSAANTAQEAEQQLDQLGIHINNLLSNSVATIHDVLCDVVTFSGEPVTGPGPAK